LDWRISQESRGFGTRPLIQDGSENPGEMPKGKDLKRKSIKKGVGKTI
jgi:hypothetical protein